MNLNLGGASPLVNPALGKPQRGDINIARGIAPGKPRPWQTS